MSAGIRKNETGVLELYQTSLERRLQQGEWDLVCRDEELCKEVETCLFECSPQDFYPPAGLDTLSVIETSLRASRLSLGQIRLKSLVKAFEVLELAALNLYLCPWRKEYKVVKMFSGMFTHCVKPALTVQQAKELFALLGYQPVGSNEEELRLSMKPVHPHTLLQLACAFFTARLECQLLLTWATLGDSIELVFQLIQERKRGCTFQIALDSAKRKLGPDPCDSPLALDATLDLYTDDNLPGHGYMASPPSLPYIPPSEDSLPNKMCRSNTSQSDLIQRNKNKAQTVSTSSLTYQINATPQNTDSSLKQCENEKWFTAVGNTQLSASKEEPKVCNCLKSNDLHRNQCLQCREDHSVDCPCFKSCMEKGHMVILAQQHMITRQEQTQSLDKPPKDDLKQHRCIKKPSKNFFIVCHDCHYIHDVNCEELLRCLEMQHNVQKTGRLQPAQVEEEVAPHTCLQVKSTDYVVCHTCHTSHDYLCNEYHSCQLSGHKVRYNEKAAKAKPMPLHHCCKSTQPTFACLTCRVFHDVSCDSNQCQRHHEVQSVKQVCCTCSDTELYILCRYCCAQHCKKCWFKTPLECKCGMPFEISAV